MDVMSIPALCCGAPSARAARDNFRHLVRKLLATIAEAMQGDVAGLSTT
jgi:hypothetical protein